MRREEAGVKKMQAITRDQAGVKGRVDVSCAKGDPRWREGGRGAALEIVHQPTKQCQKSQNPNTKNRILVGPAGCAEHLNTAGPLRALAVLVCS